MEPKACTGSHRVNRGKWYTPIGKTPKECTYCEWCISNHCVDLEPGYTTSNTLYNCNCDCPVKSGHPPKVPYNCGNHQDDVGDCEMGDCLLCRTPCSTSSGMDRYCNKCSANYGVCHVCGINKNGVDPFKVQTRMLSQNGRLEWVDEDWL